MGSSRRIISNLGFNKYIIMLICFSIGFAVVFDIIADTQSGPDLQVTVVRVEPDGKTENRNNITIQFSHDMVPDFYQEDFLVELPH